MEEKQDKVSSHWAPDSAVALQIKVFSMSTEEGKGSYDALF